MKEHDMQGERFERFVATFKGNHPELRGGNLVRAYRRAWRDKVDGQPKAETAKKPKVADPLVVAKEKAKEQVPHPPFGEELGGPPVPAENKARVKDGPKPKPKP